MKRKEYSQEPVANALSVTLRKTQQRLTVNFIVFTQVASDDRGSA